MYRCDLLHSVMKLLNQAIQEKKFDVRNLEKNLLRGVVQYEDLHYFEKNLSDDVGYATWISIESLEKEEKVERDVPSF